MSKTEHGIAESILEVVTGFVLIGLITGLFACFNLMAFKFEAVGMLLRHFNNISSSAESLEVFGTILGISYSVIFLTITLLSSLSDKDETIYWERFTEYRLVRPRVFNFLGMSIMGFESLAIETIAFLFLDGYIRIYVFWASFVFGIVIVTILFFRMSGVYFNRTHYLNRLEQDYQRLVDEYVSTDSKSNTTYQRIKSCFQQLTRYTVSAAEKKNTRVVYDNVDFLMRYSVLEDDGFSDRLLEGKASKKDIISNLVRVTLFDLFDNLDSIGENNLIISVIRKYIDAIDTEEGKYLFTNWIVSQKSRIDIWNSYTDDIITNKDNGEVEDSITSYIARNTKQIMTELELIRHRILSSKFAGFDRLTNRYERLRVRYKKNITNKLSFFLENQLESDLIALLAELALNNDPINPILAGEGFAFGSIDTDLRRGFFHYFINSTDDEHRLAESILACFQALRYHAGDPERFKDCNYAYYRENERRCVEAVRLAVLSRGVIGKELEIAFHEFMCKVIPHSEGIKGIEEYAEELVIGIREKNYDQKYLIDFLEYLGKVYDKKACVSLPPDTNYGTECELWVKIREEAKDFFDESTCNIIDEHIDRLQRKMRETSDGGNK